MTTLLEAGGVLINPAALHYAVVETDSEGLGLRLGFAESGGTPGELRLTGLEARTVLRWLRRNAEVRDVACPARRHDGPAHVAAPRLVPGRPCSLGDASWVVASSIRRDLSGWAA
ncbi:MAG: hypothetical protein P4L84_28090, partial [Isosphaeraceae bacterium]|nr:hypothetical protein [Isosphaeraceae bacterium]